METVEAFLLGMSLGLGVMIGIVWVVGGGDLGKGFRILISMFIK